MRIPASTYRLQINADFTFARVRALTDYFARLGVGDLYFAPVFQARANSPHGYDVTNPGQFNREAGDEAQFEALSLLLHERDIGILLDIVPNHMAASEDNPWWRDILEHGPASVAASFFDVEWDAPHAGSRIVLPVLGCELDAALEQGQITLDFLGGEFLLRYFERSFPVDPGTYSVILEQLDGIDAALVAEARAIGPRNATTLAEQVARRDRSVRLKERLRAKLPDQLPQSTLGRFLYLRDLIEKQAFRLEFWQTGMPILNYRRFFDVSDLAGVRVEDPDVFAVTHSLILELIRSRQIDGVRVDHVDGLRNPAGYLADLRRAIGDTFVVVEKILAPKENLPEPWPIEGTTGYDFCGLIAGLYCEPEGLGKLTEAYHARTGAPPFADIVFEKKKRVIDVLFAGELKSLANALERLADLCGVNIENDSIPACITEVSACLPVYRTYITDEISSYDRCVIKSAVSQARHRTPAVPDASYAFMRNVLLGDDLPDSCGARRAEFIANWQQFTGPVMAKGLEDTAFYTYNRLIALSEVGAHPDAVVASTREFHEIMTNRARTWPHTLNASSTHDTKRSEDVRARIQVLSEMPERWAKAVDAWTRIGDRHRTTLNGIRQPEINEQLLIFQTLLGVWPLHERERAELPRRLHGFLQKAAREAKHHSSWLDPNEEYERALHGFTNGLIADAAFVQSFTPLQQDLAWYGALNSLSQLVVKLCAPGVPDIYQGSESWMFSLVDPDNRRPVDFDALHALLDLLPRRIDAAAAADMLRGWQDGRIKMHVTHAGLKLRRSQKETFENGEYIGVAKRGKFARNVIPFARRHPFAAPTGSRTSADNWVLIAAGRYFSTLGPLPVGSAWADTMLDLPAGAPSAWRNALTGEVTDGRSLEAVFATLPFAIMVPA